MSDWKDCNKFERKEEEINSLRAQLAESQAQNAALLAALKRIENECSCDTPEVCYDVACDALSSNPQAPILAVRRAQHTLTNIRAVISESECREDEDCDHCVVIYHEIDPSLEALDAAFGKGAL